MAVPSIAPRLVSLYRPQAVPVALVSIRYDNRTGSPRMPSSFFSSSRLARVYARLPALRASPSSAVPPSLRARLDARLASLRASASAGVSPSRLARLDARLASRRASASSEVSPSRLARFDARLACRRALFRTRRVSPLHTPARPWRLRINRQNPLVYYKNIK